MKLDPKSLVKRSLANAGLELVRKRPMPPPFIPHIEHYELHYRGGECPAEFDFWLSNRSAEQWYKEWFWEAKRPTWELDEMGWLLEAGDRVLEVGCHHGFLTMMLLHVIGENGFVLGVDANPENAQIASSQLALNQVGCRGKVLFSAVADRRGTQNFAWRTNSHAVQVDEDVFTYPVETVTADDLDAEYGSFNVLKVDVEGFEVSVLRGAEGLLARRPKLILEFHPHFMKKYGYGDSLADVFHLIDFDQYEGTLTYFERWGEPETFSIENVPTDNVSYAFLKPKSDK